MIAIIPMLWFFAVTAYALITGESILYWDFKYLVFLASEVAAVTGFILSWKKPAVGSFLLMFGGLGMWSYSHNGYSTDFTVWAILGFPYLISGLLVLMSYRLSPLPPGTLVSTKITSKFDLWQADQHATYGFLFGLASVALPFLLMFVGIIRYDNCWGMLIPGICLAVPGIVYSTKGWSSGLKAFAILGVLISIASIGWWSFMFLMCRAMYP